MGIKTPHKDPIVGQALDSLDFEVTEAMLTNYYDGLGLQRTPGSPIPSMVASAADDFHSQSRFDQERGHLWTRQEWDLRAPLRPGVAYEAHGRIEDIYRRRNRTVVITAMTLVDPDGAIVAASNHHQSFLLDDDEVRLRHPAEKEGARTFTVPAGTPLQELDVTVSLEMCGQYFHGLRHYHTDLAASQELGFEEVVVGGRMTMSYVGHLLERHFGEPWWTSGWLDLKFTNPVWPDDHLVVKGVDTGSSLADPGRRDVFAWIEKDDGSVAVVANASCLIG